MRSENFLTELQGVEKIIGRKSAEAAASRNEVFAYDSSVVSAQEKIKKSNETLRQKEIELDTINVKIANPPQKPNPSPAQTATKQRQGAFTTDQSEIEKLKSAKQVKQDEIIKAKAEVEKAKQELDAIKAKPKAPIKELGLNDINSLRDTLGFMDGLIEKQNKNQTVGYSDLENIYERLSNVSRDLPQNSKAVNEFWSSVEEKMDSLSNLIKNEDRLSPRRVDDLDRVTPTPNQITTSSNNNASTANTRVSRGNSRLGIRS